jgi:hypothetical protein
MVLVKSGAQLVNIRVVSPPKMTIKLAMDETRFCQIRRNKSFFHVKHRSLYINTPALIMKYYIFHYMSRRDNYLKK